MTSFNEPTVLPDDIKQSGDVRWPRRDEIWHAVQVTVDNDYSIAAGAEVFIPWDFEDYDTSAFHDNVTNNTRLTAPLDGIYFIFASVRLNGVTNLVMRFRHNGSTSIHIYRRDGTVSGDTNHYFCASWHFNRGDYVELGVDFDDGTARTLFHNEFSKFGMYRVA